MAGQSHTLILYFEAQTQKELTQQDLSNAKFRRREYQQRQGGRKNAAAQGGKALDAVTGDPVVRESRRCLLQPGPEQRDGEDDHNDARRNRDDISGAPVPVLAHQPWIINQQEHEN